MKITDYHAKYFAEQIIRRLPSDTSEKFAPTLLDAKVELKPHQIMAALFAFRSPLSKGAVLADEVGLGKTIEAGIILSQKWAEGKKKILIITPSSLRQQWSEELLDKFYLSNNIIEGSMFKLLIKDKIQNPFLQDKIVICSYQYAAKKADYIKQIDWDLVVIDEAHKLRNVYRSDSGIAKSILIATENRPKLLLTATPLQNSIMELYGLSTFIDPYLFGDIKAFKSRYSKLLHEEEFKSPTILENFSDLRRRISTMITRTLRRDAVEFTRFTKRYSFTEKFYPTEEEHSLYTLVDNYLRREELYALPKSQRQLIVTIMRKLLASSTFAIAKTLRQLVDRLNTYIKSSEKIQSIPEIDLDDLDDISEFMEEWEDVTIEEIQKAKEVSKLTSEQKKALIDERNELI